MKKGAGPAVPLLLCFIFKTLDRADEERKVRLAVHQQVQKGTVQNTRSGRERRQRALLRLSVILWVLVCCIILCNKAVGAAL